MFENVFEVIVCTKYSNLFVYTGSPTSTSASAGTLGGLTSARGPGMTSFSRETLKVGLSLVSRQLEALVDNHTRSLGLYVGGSERF